MKNPFVASESSYLFLKVGFTCAISMIPACSSVTFIVSESNRIAGLNHGLSWEGQLGVCYSEEIVIKVYS